MPQANKENPVRRPTIAGIDTNSQKNPVCTIVMETDEVRGRRRPRT